MSWLIGLALVAVVAVLVVGYLNLPASSFRPAFEATLTEDEGGWEGYTLVQRIEAVRLKRYGRQVRITLRASSTQDAWIDSIWISQRSLTGNPYDAADDLKLFYGKARVRANTSLTLSDTLPDVNYNFETLSPLLIAVDFERGAPSGIRFQDAVPPKEALLASRVRSGEVEPNRRVRSGE